MWRSFDAQFGYRIWHWTFLALAAPFPEEVIGRGPVEFWNRMSGGSAPGGSHWRRSIRARSRITMRVSPILSATFTHAARITAPAAPPDLKNDEADRAAGRRIGAVRCWCCGAAPALPSSLKTNPLDTWREWAPDLRGGVIDGGHYLPEENPDATAKALLEFFK